MYLFLMVFYFYWTIFQHVVRFAFIYLSFYSFFLWISIFAFRSGSPLSPGSPLDDVGTPVTNLEVLNTEFLIWNLRTHLIHRRAARRHAHLYPNPKQRKFKVWVRWVPLTGITYSLFKYVLSCNVTICKT